MPSGLTREQVEAVAALASLELEPAEIDLFVKQLGDVLAYADEVQQVDTAGIEPTTSVARHSADRADELKPSLNRDDALEAAPDPALEAGFFKVPRVIGG